jgi:hypothetical protein
MPSLKVECESCAGTGLYVGFAEAPGTAAICVTCVGTGCQEIRYKEWLGRRKGRRGIHTVKRAWGRGRGITYEEFARGKEVPPDDRG